MEDEKKPYDFIGAIIEFESGSLSTPQALELFSYLIKNDLAYKLQGSYGRTANQLIELGYLLPNGDINPDWEDLV